MLKLLHRLQVISSFAESRFFHPAVKFSVFPNRWDQVMHKTEGRGWRKDIIAQQISLSRHPLPSVVPVGMVRWGFVTVSPLISCLLF